MSGSSPRKGGVGMLQNFMSLDSPDSDVRSSRIALKDELVGKLVFDDPRVFNRLALGRVPDQLVTSCAEAFATDQTLLDARRELNKITASAIGKPIEELEVDVLVNDSSGIRKEKKKSEEKKMYAPLRSIFQHVENFHDSSSLFKRSFESTDSTVLKSDSSTWGFPKGSPDFGLFDCSSSTAIASGRKTGLWRQTRGFCEVKPTPQQGPKSLDPKVVKPVVCQAADYARLHLSARPFQLFSVGLLIFGSKFCIAIFDRAGVVFSPVHDMWEDTEIFIRVIRSLTYHLSSIELGQDPTVTTLPDPQHEIWRGQTKDLGREAPKDFPTYVITTGGSSSPSWYTIGLPIWTSISLLGRGTSIWLVQEDRKGPVLVLKDTWRDGSRTSESRIYGAIGGDHPALAKFYKGQDVLFPGEQQYITSTNLHGPAIDQKIEGDVCLHRLLLKNHGRPLWEYRSEKELLQGIRAALSAHEFLCNQGILHRDISAGNIMLPMKTPPDVGAEGFLMDLEFARLERTSLDTTTTIAVPPLRMPGGGMSSPTKRSHTIFGLDVMRGVAMTGTAQFMAAEILQAILTERPIMHEPRHDIESFIYVLAYSVTRRAVLESRSLDDDTRTKLHLFFYSTFGRMKMDDIWISRRGQGPLTLFIRFPNIVSAPMSELLSNLDIWLAESRLPSARNSNPLAHTYLLSELDKAIEKMTLN